MEDSKIIKKAEDILHQLLQLLDVEAETKISIEVEDGDRKYLNAKIEGEELGYLIGYRGKTLGSLQTIFNQMLSNKIEESIPSIIDVNNYRQRRNDYLQSLARRAAGEARESRQNTELPPLSGFERRVVHLALKDEDDVITESTGLGAERHIVVKFKPN